jgi:molybdenum cofactor cytidylyltransferase
MGRPKLLLPWGSSSIIGHLIRVWRKLAAARIAVVCAPGGQALAGELDRLGFPGEDRILNPAPEQGMFSSIQCAARWPGWPRELTHYAIVLGDQPQVPVRALSLLLEFVAAHPEQVCQPSRGGRGRHPVVLPRSIFRAIADAGEITLKDFLGNTSVSIARCEIDEPALDVDLDTPSDYAQALKSFPVEGESG